MKRMVLGLGILLSAILPVGLQAKSAKGGNNTGSIEGILRVTAPPRPQGAAAATPTPEGSSSYGYGGYYSSSPAPRPPDPEEVVVYLKDVAGSYAPPAEHVHLDQKYLRFTHRVVPVLKGTVVDFTNHDPVYHNVFTNSKANPFDLGRKGNGQEASVTMVKSEVPVKVYCEIHSSMKSNILVLDNPFFTTVHPGGRFKIKGVPPGTYTLVAWHDYWAPVERNVTVDAGGTCRVDVTLEKVQK